MNVSTYEWLFKLEDDEIEDFYKSCMADELGSYIDNPFTTHPEEDE